MALALAGLKTWRPELALKAVAFEEPWRPGQAALQPAVTDLLLWLLHRSPATQHLQIFNGGIILINIEQENCETGLKTLEQWLKERQIEVIRQTSVMYMRKTDISDKKGKSEILPKFPTWSSNEIRNLWYYVEQWKSCTCDKPFFFTKQSVGRLE